MDLRLADRFVYTVDLQLPGFKQKVPPGSVAQLSFSHRTADEWYADFLDQVYSAIGNCYFPIYRMADGEFIFCVGRKSDLPHVNANILERFTLRTKGRIKEWLGPLLPAEQTIWGEGYPEISRDQLMQRFVCCLKNVAEHGMLALHFTRSPGRFSEQYIEPLSAWFEDNKIPLLPQNYTSFYFVYALLCGPESRTLFHRRRVLVITSATQKKFQRIKESLMALGSTDVQFAGISANQAMLDTIDLKPIHKPVDIVLVAAGIGAVNILDQLKPLCTVCIDAGIFLEILSDSQKRGRIFTVPDKLMFDEK